MAITLGQLRAFASEQASYDVSSEAGDRKIMSWINGALKTLWASHAWRFAQSVGYLQLLPEETGSGLTLAQGSRALTLVAETFLAKYVNERWALSVTGEDRKTFYLSEILTATSARLREDQLWTRDTETGAAYSWSRVRYPLPEDARELRGVELVRDGWRLNYLEPYKFDWGRSGFETDRSGPTTYTVRGNEIEVWPGPGEDYEELKLLYRRKAPTYLTSTPDEEVVDWPEAMDHLLYRGILRESTLLLGASSVAKYEVVRAEFEDLLRKFKSEDSAAAELGGPMCLDFTPTPQRPIFRSGEIDYS